jgi:hypothetical protein
LETCADDLAPIRLTRVSRERDGGRTSAFVIPESAHLADECVAVLVGHPDIGDKHIRLRLLQHAECLGRRGGGRHFGPASLKDGDDEVERVRLVVYYEDAQDREDVEMIRTSQTEAALAAQYGAQSGAIGVRNAQVDHAAYTQAAMAGRAATESTTMLDEAASIKNWTVRKEEPHPCGSMGEMRRYHRDDVDRWARDERRRQRGAKSVLKAVELAASEFMVALASPDLETGMHLGELLLAKWKDSTCSPARYSSASPRTANLGRSL